MSNNILEIKNLVVNFGGIKAVDGVSIDVEQGKIVTLVGANGAGKSTILRCVSGIVRPKSGDILFEGQSIIGKTPDNIVSRGITLVPEGRRVFPNLTVLENLKLGAYLRKDSISGGEQQMLAVGRALMSRPKLVMMDEPSLGLAPLVVKSIFEIIRTINSQGITVLLIEQNANVALQTAHKGYVLETGHITMQGTGHELLADETVKEAYLGKSRA